MASRHLTIESWGGGASPAKIYGDLDVFQVGVIRFDRKPKKDELKKLWADQAGKSNKLFVVAAVYEENAYLFGPSEEAGLLELPAPAAKRFLQAVLCEPNAPAAWQLFDNYRLTFLTAIAGLVNSGLFADHCLRNNAPSHKGWQAAVEKARHARKFRNLNEYNSKELWEALGFEPSQSGEYSQSGKYDVLSSKEGAHFAIGLVLKEGENFDRNSSRLQASPAVYGLKIAADQELRWLIISRGSQLRIYPTKPAAGVGQKPPTETFLELHLDLLDDDYLALLWLIFSADALKGGGSADELLEESRKYAVGLGARLRERIYSEVFPPLACEVAAQLARQARKPERELSPEELSQAYHLTMRIFFRLLFQAYAEDRKLLPVDNNSNYYSYSLKYFALAYRTASGFEADRSRIWSQLDYVWQAIDKGDRSWGIPAYNGGLFAAGEESPEGHLIAQLQLPDAVMGPVLRSLLIDQESDEASPGPVDFRSLSVREFGTIYEGLLENSLALIDGRVQLQLFSGDRKTSGSYFTPHMLVEYLLERSIDPALAKHLKKIEACLDRGDSDQAAKEFFDFRVADLAMGSGHFLIAAIDRIEAGMSRFLADHPIPGVQDQLDALRAAAEQALAASSDTAASATVATKSGEDKIQAADRPDIDEAKLLRRLIARRCIYGIDINDLAVQLARLAVWVHTFVPGLPMSNLDHTLVQANSVVGFSDTEEAIAAFAESSNRGYEKLLRGIAQQARDKALPLLEAFIQSPESTLDEVKQNAYLLEQAKQALEPLRRLYQVAIARRLGMGLNAAREDRIIAEVDSLVESAEDITNNKGRVIPQGLEDAGRIEKLVQVIGLRPGHFLVMFPEVFARQNPGFDVLIGNPPWEKLKVDERRWWSLHFPGSSGKGQTVTSAFIAQKRQSRPDLQEKFEQAKAEAAIMNEAVRSNKFPGLGKSDTDLHQAFAWRNWWLLRSGGKAALVLPRGAFLGGSLEPWRREIVQAGSFSVCFLTNSKEWIFPGVDGRYEVALTVLNRDGDKKVSFAGPYTSEAKFVESLAASPTLEVDSADFLAFSSLAAFPRLPDSESGKILALMNRQPRFGQAQENCDFRPARDLDASNDKHLWSRVTGSVDTVPVYHGACFNLWEPDFQPPDSHAPAAKLREHLREKLARQRSNKRSAYYGMRFDPGELPMDSARIGVRWITNSTNTRTVIACLLPPGTPAANSASLLVNRCRDSRAEAFTLGVLSSRPLDWAARRWVDQNLTFEILNDLPFPRYDPESPVVKRIIEVAGRLAAADERYRAWAEAVGVPVGSVTPDEKPELIAELDALVALAYGLSAEQVTHIFRTFHKGWEHKPELEKTMPYYQKWA